MQRDCDPQVENWGTEWSLPLNDPQTPWLPSTPLDSLVNSRGKRKKIDEREIDFRAEVRLVFENDTLEN